MSKMRELSPDEFRTQVRERRSAFMQAWEHVKDDGLMFQKHTSPSENRCDQLHASLPQLVCPAQELEMRYSST